MFKFFIGIIVYIELEVINYNICVDKFCYVELNLNIVCLEMFSVFYDVRL